METELIAPYTTPRARIGIVGAGISGLRCADVLLENGFQVTILEARDRIGGRIHTSDKLGYTADIGPNWIHTHGTGSRHPILDLAKKTDTPLHTWNSKQNIYDSSGKLLSEEKSNELSTLLWKLIDEAFEYSAKHGKEIQETESLYDFVAARAKEEFPDYEYAELLCQMSEMWGAYIGDPISKQSLRFAWMEECCGGEEMFVETTYQAILKEVAKSVVVKARIRLNERVLKVESTHRDLSDGNVRVTTEKGETLCFDEVIMTTPLGWLKQNGDAFQPHLPKTVSNAVDNISVGQLEKVFITFPEAFWNDEISRNEDSTEDEFPGYTNWLSPNYSLATNPNRWPQEIWNLSAFSPRNRKPTILFYIYGDCSRYLTNLVHKKATGEHHRLLNDFFYPYYSLLQNFSTDKPACKPKAILSTEWQKDELAGYGSYCNFQIGTRSVDADVKAIRNGVPERRLWFAGEHTAPFEELGTAAGAYLSGERVAERIVGLYKQERQNLEM